MNSVHLAWMLGRPSSTRSSSQILTVSAYAMVNAMLLIVLGGAYSFTSFEREAQATYLPLAGFAVVLLAVPLMVLGSAAARLSARTQDRALSSLRLLGATGGQILSVSLLQAAGTALAGALAGVVLYLASSPLVAMIRFQGAPLGDAIYLPWWAVAIAVVVIVLLAVISSLAGLRKLIITPLAVATRQSVPVPSWIRVLVTVGSVALLYFVFTNISVVSQEFGTIIAVIILGFGFGLLVLNLAGPWLVATVGRQQAEESGQAGAAAGGPHDPGEPRRILAPGVRRRDGLLRRRGRRQRGGADEHGQRSGVDRHLVRLPAAGHPHRRAADPGYYFCLRGRVGLDFAERQHPGPRGPL